MRQLILAPSCSGKTHFTSRAYGTRGVPVIDGDDVIAATVTWASYKQAGHDPQRVAAYHKEHAQVICDVLRSNEDATIAFNTDAKILVPLARRAGVQKIVGVVLSAADYRRNVALRNSAIARGVSGHSKVQRPEDIIEAAEKNKAAYVELGLPIVSSFAQLEQHLSLYISKRKEP